ncbi:DUF6286 domain-containing protein [Cellulomonas sp. P22]|uniref:DUF6286 domain-containing protein n=1 Tax=Cellulomonas sp. P22 TaxID=3373189 RepID=UPI0037A3F15A
MSAQHLAPGSTPLRPARELTGSGVIGVVGVVLAVLTVALGVALVRDALVAAGVLSGTTWYSSAVDALDGLEPTTGVLIAGIVLALVGLWLVVVAFRRRRRKTLQLQSAAGVGLRPKALARLAKAAAADVDGVLEARAGASRSTVDVEILTTGDRNTALRVRDVVAARLAPLKRPPRVNVRARASHAHEGTTP